MLRVAAFGGICFDLPSCTQKGMHSDNKMTFSVEKLSQVSFALQRRQKIKMIRRDKFLEIRDYNDETKQ